MAPIPLPDCPKVIPKQRCNSTKYIYDKGDTIPVVCSQDLLHRYSHSGYAGDTSTGIHVTWPNEVQFCEENLTKDTYGVPLVCDQVLGHEGAHSIHWPT